MKSINQKNLFNYNEKRSKSKPYSLNHVLRNLNRLFKILIIGIKIDNEIKKAREYREKFCCPYCGKPRLLKLNGEQIACPHEVKFNYLINWQNHWKKGGKI